MRRWFCLSLLLTLASLASGFSAAQPRRPELTSSWDDLMALELVESDLARSQLWTAAGITPAGLEWVKANGEAWPEIVRIFEDPELAGPLTSITDPLAEPPRNVRTAATMASMRAILAADAGHPLFAARLLELTLSAMRRIEAAPGSLLGYLVSVAGELAALRAAREIAERHPMTDDWAAWQALGSGGLRAPPPSLQLGGALLCEADFMVRGLSRYEALPEDAMFRQLVDEVRELGQELLEELGMTYDAETVFQPDQTAVIAQLTYAYAIEVLSPPRWKRDATAVAGLKFDPDDADQVKPLLGRPNLAGNLICGILIGVAPPAADKADQLSAYRAMTAVTIALRAYTEQHQALPASLEALVDDGLIERLPADPFDGEPLRFDANRRLLWAVGTDEVDDQGQPDTDVVVAFNFR